MYTAGNQPVAPAKRKPRAKLPYDPTGLRTAKTVTLEAAEIERAKHFTNHWAKPSWYSEIDSITAECEAKGIPVTPGRRPKYNLQPGYNSLIY